LYDSIKQFNYLDGFDGERKVQNHKITIKIEAIPELTGEFLYTIFQKGSDATLWGINVIYPTRKLKLLVEGENWIVMSSTDVNEDVTLKLHHDGFNISRISLQNLSKGIYTEYVN